MLRLDCNNLLEWVPSIINHLYWSISTCNGNGEELAERFLSCIHHCCNRHTFIGNKFYSKCDHDKYSKDEERTRKWIVPDSPAHLAIKQVLLGNKQLVRDLKQLNENIFTTHLEVFHALKIRYLPKSIFFEQEKMVAGVELAALDHNSNINRRQVSFFYSPYVIMIILFFFFYIKEKFRLP